MDKLISQQAAIDEAEKWFFNLEDKRTVGEVLKGLPSIDAVNRQEAIDKIKKRLFETALNNVGIKQNIDETLIDVAENRLENWFNELPPIQPERKDAIEKAVAVEAISDELMSRFDISATYAYEVAEAAVNRIEVMAKKMYRGERYE